MSFVHCHYILFYCIKLMMLNVWIFIMENSTLDIDPSPYPLK